MKNQETSNTFITEIRGKEKIKYEAPTCHFIELELESPVLQASAEHFGDGGSYGRGERGLDSWDW